jgi:hypothetical protein
MISWIVLKRRSRFWSNHGQMLMNRRSDVGQILLIFWSSNGQRMVRFWSDFAYILMD